MAHLESGGVSDSDQYQRAKANVANLAEQFLPDGPLAVAQLDQGRSVLRADLARFGVSLDSSDQRHAAAVGAIILGHILMQGIAMTPDVAQLITAEMSMFLDVAEG